jgi:RNA polymerase sigma-70 factor (ECF subfamily)
VNERWTADAAYRLLAEPVYGYLRSIDRVDADDLFGDVFVAVAARIDGFDGDATALRSWVFTIAHHRVVDWQRRRRRRALLPHRRVDDAPAPGDPFDPQLIAALSKLTTDQREVVVLRFVADLPLESVAEITGRTVGAVKALQHRALAQLAALLE